MHSRSRSRTRTNNTNEQFHNARHTQKLSHSNQIDSIKCQNGHSKPHFFCCARLWNVSTNTNIENNLYEILRNWLWCDEMHIILDLKWLFIICCGNFRKNQKCQHGDEWTYKQIQIYRGAFSFAGNKSCFVSLIIHWTHYYLSAWQECRLCDKIVANRLNSSRLSYDALSSNSERSSRNRFTGSYLRLLFVFKLHFIM